MQKFASEMHLDRGVGHKKRQFAENRRGLRTCKEIWLSFHDNFFLLLESSINNIIFFQTFYPLSPTSFPAFYHLNNIAFSYFLTLPPPPHTHTQCYVLRLRWRFFKFPNVSKIDENGCVFLPTLNVFCTKYITIVLYFVYFCHFTTKRSCVFSLFLP